MVHSNQDVALSHHMVFLLAFLDIFLLEDLHGIDPIALFALLLYQDHLCV